MNRRLRLLYTVLQKRSGCPQPWSTCESAAWATCSRFVTEWTAARRESRRAAERGLHRSWQVSFYVSVSSLYRSLLCHSDSSVTHIIWCVTFNVPLSSYIFIIQGFQTLFMFLLLTICFVLFFLGVNMLCTMYVVETGVVERVGDSKKAGFSGK